jgi:hypothetical protein
VWYLPGTWRDFGVTVASLAGGIAGLSFLLKAGGGLYWMIPAVLAGLVGGVINACLFLIKVPGSSVPG